MMKQLFSTLLLLLCCTLGVQARSNFGLTGDDATDYGISVTTTGGETFSVNSVNYSDVLGDGTVSYDLAQNTLTLNGAHLFGFLALDFCKPNLQIKVVGKENTIDEYFMLNTSCTLVGNNTKSKVTSQLNVNSLAFSSALTIQDLAVEFIGGKQGLSAQSGTASLTLKNAVVNAEGAAGVFKSIPSLVLEDCEILTPEGAYYDPAKKYIVDESGNRVTGVVTIGPKVEPVVKYGIWINSSPYDKLEITSENCADVLGDGTLSYDPATNVLSLNNLQAPDKYLSIGELSEDLSFKTMESLNGGLAGIKVKVIGDNALKHLSFNGGVNGTLCGDGNLLLQENMDGPTPALHSWDNLLIEDCNLVARGGIGIEMWSYMGAPGKLTIRNATIKIESSLRRECIEYFTDLVLEGCSILKPFGAYIDPAKQEVVDKDGNPVMDELEIGKPVTPEKGTGTKDDPFVLDDALDKLLGGGGTGGTGTGGTGGGSTGGTGTGTGVDGTGSGRYPNPPVIITPPAGTSSHYSYTAKDDCVLGIVAYVGNEFEGKLIINGADAGNIEEREMILHKGDVVMLNIANAGKDDKVGINIRNLCEGDLWYWAFELREGKNDIQKVVENKNLPRWYKVTAPANTPMAINMDAAGKADVFTDENVEKGTRSAWFWTTSEGIAYNYSNASSTPLTFYVKLIAAEKDCIATVSFDPTVINTLSTESDNVPAYNLQGLRVGKDYKGIVIINGKKIMR